MSVKVSTPSDVDMVAVGSFYAGANVVNLDGAYGGTGAAPNIAKKNIAMPIELAVRRVHQFLDGEGIRDQVALITGGGIRSADDALKAIALGADGVAIGTAELVAIDCVKCGNCERGRGCPIGIATTDPQLSTQLSSEWVRDRILNMYCAWTARMRRRLSRLGYKSVRDFSGATDALKYVERGMGNE
jgi:glutamate synthase domain-containing protein 2